MSHREDVRLTASYKVSHISKDKDALNMQCPLQNYSLSVVLILLNLNDIVVWISREIQN